MRKRAISQLVHSYLLVPTSAFWGRRTLCAVPSNALFDAIFILVGLLIGLRYLYGL